MKPPRSLAFPILLLLGACGSSVSGVVKDGLTERPIGGASVQLVNVGWGLRGGQIVWDAEKVSESTTKADGQFQFDEDGGVALRVSAPGHAQVETSLCPRSPTVVRVGGPYPELRAERRLIFGTTRQQAGLTDSSDPRAAFAGDLGVHASGSAVEGDGQGLRIRADGGVRFIAGTGVIPAPPPLPYAEAVDLQLGSDCGWLFVSDGASPVAVIKVRPLNWEQHPGQQRRYAMFYTPLPGR